MRSSSAAMSVEQLDAAIEFANHLPDLRCFPLHGFACIKMTLVFHCMLQNDPDSQRSARAPWMLGRSRKNLAKGVGGPKKKRPQLGGS